MDETAARLRSMERKVAALLGLVVILASAIAAQLLGWVPSLRTSEVRTEKIVLTSTGGLHRSVEISDRGIKLADADEGTELWVLPPSGAAPCIVASSATGRIAMSPSEVRLSDRLGGDLEISTSPKGGPHITFLGGSGASRQGQTDIGAALVGVTGGGGSTVIDGRHGSLGIRVMDENGKEVPLASC